MKTVKQGHSAEDVSSLQTEGLRLPESMARMTIQYIGGSSPGSNDLHNSSVGALQVVSSRGSNRVMSACETSAPASNVNVRSDNITKIAKHILPSVRSEGTYRFCDSFAIQVVQVVFVPLKVGPLRDS
jgi:hypothetical protein